MISNDRPWLTVSGTKLAQVCPNLGFLGPIQLLVSEFLSSFVQSMNSLPKIRCYFLRVWYLYMFHYEKMVSQKSFGTDIDQNVDLVTSQSAFEQIFFTVSSHKSRSLQMSEPDFSISFWAKQDHSWIWFWIWQFQAFLCLAGLGLGDIERKAIYFNQGLPAQLLTIVGWMGAINKTYGPLPQQLASTSKPVAARRQHGCRRAADHCLF